MEFPTIDPDGGKFFCLYCKPNDGDAIYCWCACDAEEIGDQAEVEQRYLIPMFMAMNGAADFEFCQYKTAEDRYVDQKRRRELAVR